MTTTLVTPELRRETLVRALPPTILVIVMWVSEIIDTLLQGFLDQFGIQPREIDALPGILAAPLLHDGFGHLAANTATFAVLGLAIAWLTRHFWAVTIGVAVIGGLAVWLIGAPGTVHLGASGLVYGYTAFLIAYGLFTKKLGAVIMSVVVFLVYGGLAVGVLPTNPTVSWEGHLFGAVAGVVMAWWLGRRDRGQS